jgi:hypothetical protein
MSCSGANGPMTYSAMEEQSISINQKCHAATINQRFFLRLLTKASYIVYVRNQFGGTCDGPTFFHDATHERSLAGLSVIDRTGSPSTMIKCSKVFIETRRMCSRKMYRTNVS